MIKTLKSHWISCQSKVKFSALCAGGSKNENLDFYKQGLLFSSLADPGDFCSWLGCWAEGPQGETYSVACSPLHLRFAWFLLHFIVFSMEICVFEEHRPSVLSRVQVGGQELQSVMPKRKFLLRFPRSWPGLHTSAFERSVNPY